MLTSGLLLCSGLKAEQATIAIASNFTQPAEQLRLAFEQHSPHTIRFSFGSSGKFYAQIRHGAPFDAFFSADQQKPVELEKLSLTVAGSRFSYALGKLYLWSAQPGIDLSPKNNDWQFATKIAIANPKLAPYGKAAVESLKQLNRLNNLKDKLVYAENIAQTYQFVLSQNAQIGFVAASQVVQQNKGSSWPVPDDYHPPIKQDAVLLKRGQQNQAAIAFLAFCKSKAAAKIIQSFGYQTLDNH